MCRTVIETVWHVCQRCVHQSMPGLQLHGFLGILTRFSLVRVAVTAMTRVLFMSIVRFPPQNMQAKQIKSLTNFKYE